MNSGFLNGKTNLTTNRLKRKKTLESDATWHHLQYMYTKFNPIGQLIRSGTQRDRNFFYRFFILEIQNVCKKNR